MSNVPMMLMACQDGQTLVIGKSTDLKGEPPNPDCMFLETDTSKLYRANGKQWIEQIDPSVQQLMTDMADVKSRLTKGGL